MRGFDRRGRANDADRGSGDRTGETRAAQHDAELRQGQPVWKLLQAIELADPAAEREHYLADSLQYLFPLSSLALYGPSGDQWQVRDPRQQDNKNDFQKQNIYDFTLAAIQLARGYAHAGNWTGPFLRLAYTPPPGSPLVGPDGIYRHDNVKLFLIVGGASTGNALLTVPYNPLTSRYEIELWGFAGDLRPLLEPKGQTAFDRGAILARPDLVHGRIEGL